MSRSVLAVLGFIWGLACTHLGAGSPEPTLTLRGHTRWIQDLAISPDNRWLVSASDDRTVRLWDLNNERFIQTLGSFRSAVTAVAFCPSGKRIAVGTWDGDLQIIAMNGHVQRKLSGHDEGITEVCFESTGSYLATGSFDDTLKIWDANNGEELMTFHQGNEYDVTTAAFHPKGKQVVTGDGENGIKIWDAETGAEIQALPGHDGTVTSVAYSPDGQRIIYTTWDDQKGG